MLARIVGQNNVVARVSVNLNTKSSTLLDEQFDPEGQVPRSQLQIKIKQLRLNHSLKQVAQVLEQMFPM